MSTEISVIVEQEIEKRWKELISNPENILELWKKDSEEKQKEIERLTPLADKYKDLLDADGYADAAVASAAVRIKYKTPEGKEEIMGRNYFLKVLQIDGVVIDTPRGYRFSSRYEKSGVGRTFLACKNDQIRTSCKFTPIGMDKFHDKYKKDSRKWYSTTNRELCLENV